MAIEAAERSRIEHEHDVLQRYDGVERVALLSLAEFVAIAPGTTGDEPVYVFIEWAPQMVERPYPGSAIWRAAIERYLAQPRDGDPTYQALRPVVEDCLRRFPSLDAWLRWANRERVVPETRRREKVSWRTIIWPW
jgi:hypothetical protein